MSYEYPQPTIPHPQVGNTKMLSDFLGDLFTMGCLKGFRFFELYLRGREELLLQVYRQGDRGAKKPAPSKAFQIAKAQKSSGISHRTQKQMKLMPSGPMLPATTPLDHDLQRDQTRTAFLIAGYARYKRPYVWLRSNHKELLKLEIDSTSNKDADNPLKLDSIAQWKANEVKVWDVIAEIVTLTQDPAPINPFAINHDFFDSLPVEECVFATGALISVLQKIYLSNVPYADQVMSDIQQLHQRHFTDFGELVELQLMQKQAPKPNRFN
ncbi:hypothetical protein K493DRAFT_404960 [Basidiobolus meristosporus CBS 931.73]|uniref:DUF7886 domain-containing protein n=1 Tax=Basidiobolus meristosporus CBS 931.73 TaxID=1314790 RepID=A0A1Y1Z077_9FUNG|nr:hypothetical protein K493DRAFT_404960 [Basidiobolus meristosporus CBS 931.73]|eukprot:ORY03524.1 hypothetical protein K493DRAFT_404960 [Basidiobolus meristosporus CBS 931.73]